MNTKKTGLSILNSLFAIVISLALLGCGSESEIDKIGDAQQCLNEATSATAMNCVTKVDGMTTTGAYNIRCAAAFVREGFANPTKYTSAFETLKGQSGTANFMGLISFSSAANITTDSTNANATFNDCYKASAKGKTLISAFGFFSTSLMKFLSDAAPTAASCKAPVQGLYNLNSCLTEASTAQPMEVAKLGSSVEDPASGAGLVQSSIGSVIIATYNISCSGSGANKDLCNTLNTAITSGGAEPRAVFRAFFINSVKPPH
ncbi:MAG: hypothetical protein JNL11_08765 [Bdellovibrionaceae bacterium]|nr:hypothetical protein [Pseudobdellovibrionaceae bacterium]